MSSLSAYEDKGLNMPTISFASSKGGAGKTTSAIILGTELAANGTDVTFIDADPAHRLIRWSTKAALPERVDVIQSEGERGILDEIDAAAQKSTFVIVDLEGSASRLASYAIGESDLVIVPSGEEQQDALATGDVSLRTSVDLDTGVDNVRVAEDGAIWVAGHSNTIALIGHFASDMLSK